MRENLGFNLVYWNLKSVNWCLSYSSFANSGAEPPGTTCRYHQMLSNFTVFVLILFIIYKNNLFIDS